MKKYWLLLLLATPVFGQESEFVIKDLSQGMYSNASPDKIPDNTAQYIQNFYTDIEPLATERNGYVKRDTTILGGIKPVYGLWEFVDSTANDWIISYSSRTFYKNVVGGTPAAFGPITTTDQIPDCAKNLGVLMCVNGTDPAWTFDGTSTATISNAPLGTHVEAWRTRFAISNIGGAKSTVRFSADGSTSTWALGSFSTDPFQLLIGGANDGDYVRCLVGAYQDSMIIGRKYDLWAVDGFDQSDVVVRNIAKDVGCTEPRAVVEVDGELIFLSARGLEKMSARSVSNISEPIRNITDVIAKNTTNQRSNTQTTQTDFDAGSISPSGNLSTSVSPGNVTMSTLAAVVFLDNTVSSFTAGTLTNLTSTVPLHLNFNTDVNSYGSINTSAPGSCTDGCSGPYYQGIPFLATSSGILSAVYVRLWRTAPLTTDYKFDLYTRGGDNSVGTQIQSVNVLAGDVSVATSTVKINFSSNSVLTSGTSYWLFLYPNGSCSALNNMKIETFSFASGSTSTFGCGSLTANTGIRYNYNAYTTTYSASGNNVSRTFDVGFSTATWLWLDVLTDSSSIPTSTTLTYQTQTSSDGVTFDSLVAATTGTNVGSTIRRFIRYKASFTGNGVATPYLYAASVTAGPFISTAGRFTSQLISIGTLISSWGPFTVSAVQSSGTITTQFGSTNTASVSAITNWTTLTNGQIPTVSTNPYAAFRSSFTANLGGANLLLQEAQTTWIEGGVVPSPVAGVYDRRYWLSYTTGTLSSPLLDSVLIYQRNKSFTLFKGIYAGSFSLWRDLFYFGNSNNTGYVYKYDVGNNDDGTDITSIIYTKSYDFDTAYRDKGFRNLYTQFLGGASKVGSFSLYYDIDQVANTFPLGSVNLNEQLGQTASKSPFSFNYPVHGRELEYTIVKSGSGDRLRLYGFTTKYALEEEQ